MKQLSRILAMSIISALMGCEAASEFGAGYNYLDAGQGAAETYPKLPAFEAQRRHAQDQYKVIAAKQSTEAEKREIAAAFYAGFANYNGRAIPAYCGQMNLYPTDFVDRFYKMNDKEEKALESILSLRKLTKEALWKKHERKMMGRAKYDLMGEMWVQEVILHVKRSKRTQRFFLNGLILKNSFLPFQEP